MQCGRKIAVIPAGERWKTDRSLRPALEDWLGAGAILQHLPGSKSPEARLAVAAWRSANPDIRNLILKCSSGKELVAKGFEQDVTLATALDVDACAPVLRDGAYQRAEYAWKGKSV
jgi:2-phosphosulfolactate phosphatase